MKNINLFLTCDDETILLATKGVSLSPHIIGHLIRHASREGPAIAPGFEMDGIVRPEVIIVRFRCFKHQYSSDFSQSVDNGGRGALSSQTRSV